MIKPMKNFNYFLNLKILSGFFILSTLIGVLINYTPVPQADMWSNFELIYEFEKQNYAYLFSQHNEHRILLPRLIYLLDYYLFNDGYYLLYFLNIFLFFIIAFLLKKFFYETPIKKKFDSSLIIFSVGMLFFWGQKSNFIWAYQSQFLLAYIIPMIAIYYSSRIHENYGHFFLSIFISFLSIVTMANGLFTLPIIFTFLLLNKYFFECLIVLLFSILSFVLYFSNYSSVENHTTFFSFINNFDSVLIFYFTLCGNYASFIVGKGNVGIFTAGLFGFCLNLGLIYFLITKFKSLKTEYLFYMSLFLVISLLSIAIGRVDFGLKSAISSRYITPSIILLCISIFYFYKYININLNNLRKYLVIFLIMLIPYQISALKNKDQKKINDFSKVVSFMMGIDSDIPHFNEIKQTEYFLENNILIFSNSVIKSALDISNNESCKLEKINGYEIIEIGNVNWNKIATKSLYSKLSHHKLYDQNGIYKGFTFNADLLTNLFYSDKSFYGFVKNRGINEDFFYCSS
jgi:hypothetical protein